MYYFVSDVHLGAGAPAEARAREQRFVAWLDAVAPQAEGIFLMGDIFDFWYEYRRVVPQGFVRTLGKLADLTDRGIRVVFFAGNHDMWVRDYLTRECGVEVYTSPQEMTLAGQRLYLAHGDNLNISGQPLLRLMNGVFRSRLLRWCFSWFVHPDWALKFGHWWSGKSRKSHSKADQQRVEEGLSQSMTAPLVEYAKIYAQSHPIDHFLFGHMHAPYDYREGGIHSVHLGCWEQTPSYAQLDGAGELTLKTVD